MPAESSTPKKRPVLKVILYALIALMFLLVVGGYYLYSKRKPLLTRYLQEKVTKESKGLYHLKFSDLDFNLFSGNYSVKNIELTADTNRYADLIAIKEAPDNLYHIKVKAFHVLNLSLIKALFQKKLQMDSVNIEQPELYVSNKNQPYNDTVNKENPQNFYPLIKKAFKQVEIKGIALTKGNFTLINRNDKEVKRTALNNLNIDVKEVFIDSLSGKDQSRFYNSKSTVFNLGNYKLATPDSLYYLTVKNVSFSSMQRLLLFDQIALVPRYSKAAFYQKVKVAKDRFALQFKTFSVNDIDLQKLINQQKIFSTSAEIRDARIEVYNNKTFPPEKNEKLRWDNFPHQELQQLAIKLKIDTLNLKNFDVFYAETENDSRLTGGISFNRITGQIFNVTNDSLSKARNHFAAANLKAHFLNTAVLQTNFKLDLTDKKGAFSCTGTLGALQAEKINQASVPLGMTRIKSGSIQKLNFTVNADNYNATGKMQLYYQNLEIELLKKEQGENNFQKKGFISALANTFIVKDANPDASGNFRTGEIKLSRKIDMSFFSFLWQSLFTGIKSSAGLTAEKDAAIETVTKTATTVLDRIKSFFGFSEEQQQKRRENREQKRAAKRSKN